MLYATDHRCALSKAAELLLGQRYTSARSTVYVAIASVPVVSLTSKTYHKACVEPTN